MPSDIILPRSPSNNSTFTGTKWSDADIAFLRDNYASMTQEELSRALNRSVGSIRTRCWLLGLNTKHPAISPDKLQAIRDWYERNQNTANGDMNLPEFAKAIGMDYHNVAREARKMGLTNSHRKPSEAKRKNKGEQSREYIRLHGHPRGMKGKKHTEATKALISEHSAAHLETPIERHLRGIKANMTKKERYGTAAPGWFNATNPYSRTKSGKREDLGGLFVRSAWEANYARYLNFLIAQGEIASWEYEAKTFQFEGITRGVMSYTPDFKVINNDGSHEWHEVKGWMDDKSKTRLKRMAKYFPDEKVILVDSSAYKALAKWKALIPDWE